MTALPPAAVIPARDSTRRLSVLTLALLAATGATDAAYLVGLLAAGGDPDPIVGVGLSLATQWVPVSLFWLVVARTRSLPVLFVAAGVTLSALGDSYYAFAMDADGYLASPSLADAGYLLFYPLLIVALVLLVPRHLGRVGGVAVLETCVATLGAAALLAVVLAPVIDGALGRGGPLDEAIAVAYPLFDLVVMAVIVGIASLPVPVGRRWGALLAGLGVFTAADIASALIDARGVYLAGTPLDAAWPLGLGLIAWWAAGMTSPPPAPKPGRTGPAALPTLAVAAGLTVLVLGTVVTVSVLAVVLAALTVGLAAVPIVFRQAMLGRMLAAQEAAVRRLTELDQEKSDLLATVNHEFRTPLTSINGHVELLLDGGAGELPTEALTMLRTIERNGTRLQHLIDEAFSASRAMATDPAPRSSVLLDGLADEIVAGFQERAADRDVRLELRVGEPAPAVLADRERLAAAIAHLVENAVKFSAPDGRVVVEVARSGDDAVVAVQDTGIGIPADDLDRLFTRFFRASNVQRAAIPGVGLGLATARQTAVAHGGDITAESAPGTGTVMTLRLPAV